jgi:hypothetical protein
MHSGHKGLIKSLAVTENAAQFSMVAAVLRIK